MSQTANVHRALSPKNSQRFDSAHRRAHKIFIVFHRMTFRKFKLHVSCRRMLLKWCNETESQCSLEAGSLIGVYLGGQSASFTRRTAIKRP